MGQVSYPFSPSDREELWLTYGHNWLVTAR